MIGDSTGGSGWYDILSFVDRSSSMNLSIYIGSGYWHTPSSSLVINLYKEYTSYSSDYYQKYNNSSFIMFSNARFIIKTDGRIYLQVYDRINTHDQSGKNDVIYIRYLNYLFSYNFNIQIKLSFYSKSNDLVDGDALAHNVI